MKKLILVLIIAFVFGTGFNKYHTLSSSKKYELKKTAEVKPVIFGENIISTNDDEFGETFSPDRNTCYFCLKSPSTITSNIVVICVSHFRDNQWSQPEIASFSGKYKDFNPAISPDGQKLFFISNRPVNGKLKPDYDIWMCEKRDEKWNEPINIGAPVNANGWELGCSAATDGTLYFSTTGTSGNPDLYKSKFIDGKYQQPESLGDSINSVYGETDPFIAPDQSYILFASQGRPDGMSDAGASISYPRGDLYISFFKDGKWTAAKNLGSTVNSNAEESNPWVSHDGTTLYFTSERNFVSIPTKQKLNYNSLEDQLNKTGNGLGDIYQVPINAVVELNQH